MRKPLLLLLLTVFYLTSYSQRGDTLKVYMDASFLTTTKASSVYNGIAIRAGDHWYFYFVYPSGKPMIKAYFKQKNHQVKDGRYQCFYENGNSANEGTFINNVQEGIWKYYYKSGRL